MNIESIGHEYENAYLIYNRKSTDDAMNQKNSLIYQRQQNIVCGEREGLPIAELTIPGFCTNGIINESHSAFKEEDEFVLASDGTVQYRILRPSLFSSSDSLKNTRLRALYSSVGIGPVVTSKTTLSSGNLCSSMLIYTFQMLITVKGARGNCIWT